MENAGKTRGCEKKNSVTHFPVWCSLRHVLSEISINAAALEPRQERKSECRLAWSVTDDKGDMYAHIHMWTRACTQERDTKTQRDTLDDNREM